MKFLPNLKSFNFALRGLIFVWKKEKHFRFHVLFACIIFILAFILKLNKNDLLILIILIAMVFVSELFNTVFERFVDILKPRIHEYAREIKDISSAAVLVISFFSAVIGIIIFLPYILDFLNIV